MMTARRLDRCISEWCTSCTWPKKLSRAGAAVLWGLSLSPFRSEAAVGVINDDSTEVGQVHFGVVHIMHVAKEAVAGRRSGIVGPEFIPIPEAVADAPGYESWSRFCLENLDTLLSRAAAAGVVAPETVTVARR